MDVGHLARAVDLVVVEIGEVLPFVFALSVAAGDFAALFFDRLSGGIVAVGDDYAYLHDLSVAIHDDATPWDFHLHLKEHFRSRSAPVPCR